MFIGMWHKLLALFGRQQTTTMPLPREDEANPLSPSPAVEPISPKKLEVRQRLRKLAKARLHVADTISDVLDRLSRLDLRGGDCLGAKGETRILDELMACDFYLLHEVIEESETLAGGGKFVALNPDANDDDAAELADICWPIDHGIITRKEDGYFFSRTRSVAANEVRGRARYFVPKMVRVDFLYLGDDGKWWASDMIAGLMRGKWVSLSQGLKRDGGAFFEEIRGAPSATDRQETHDSIAMTFSLALTRRYSWHVALGNCPDGPRLLVPTNPLGCLQFFKNRERGSAARRAALRHWVSHHYRETDNTGIAYVRDHLRGLTDFRWFDLECEIFVSAFDLEKNEHFKREADAWRSARKHNSVRVRLKRRHQDKDFPTATARSLT